MCVSLVTQSYQTLRDLMDYSPPGSSVHADSPGKNPGVGCHFLLQGIFPTQGANPGLPHCRWILYCLSHQGVLAILCFMRNYFNISDLNNKHLLSHHFCGSGIWVSLLGGSGLESLMRLRSRCQLGCSQWRLDWSWNIHFQVTYVGPTGPLPRSLCFLPYEPLHRASWVSSRHDSWTPSEWMISEREEKTTC